MAAPPARIHVRGFRLVNDQPDAAHPETLRPWPPRFTASQQPGLTRVNRSAPIHGVVDRRAQVIRATSDSRLAQQCPAQWPLRGSTRPVTGPERMCWQPCDEDLTFGRFCRSTYPDGSDRSKPDSASVHAPVPAGSPVSVLKFLRARLKMSAFALQSQ